jgi:hypothetical protein
MNEVEIAISAAKGRITRAAKVAAAVRERNVFIRVKR